MIPSGHDDTPIIHLDIDAFFASVEQALFPSLRGRPVIVGNGVIASVSYEGRACGLKTAMPLWQARRICPEAVVLDGSYHVYRCFADRVFAFCATRTPVMETFLDEAYLDMHGGARLVGASTAVAADLRREIRGDTGLPVTCGVAPNRMLAKMASKAGKPDGLEVLVPAQVEDFLVPRKIGDLPGVGPRIARDMAAYGITTIGEFRDLSAAVLHARYGKCGDALHERARGRDTVAISAREVPRSISRETSFHSPTSDPLEITGMLHYLIERGMRAARRLGLRVGRIDVRVRYEDAQEAGSRASQRMGHRFRPPVSCDAEAFSAAREVLGRLYGPAAGRGRRVNLRHLGLTLSGFRPEEPLAQGVLFDPGERKKARRLHEAVDRIRDRFGHSAIVAGRSIGLLGELEQNRHGFVLRTPSLTK